MTRDSDLLPYLRKATIELKEAQSKLREIEERETEPIAIIGIGCRYAGGVRSGQNLWELVAGEGDAISDFPDNRGWNLDLLADSDHFESALHHTSYGGFIADVDLFDPEFFGIDPEEAAAMDPQQRLFLEICWEALERSRLDPTDLRGSSAGVFVGVSYQDYRLLSIADPDAKSPLTGSVASVLSGRVSNVFGFEGPALSVDTACSSSLVAIHLAIQSLRQEECPVAVAGGVTVLASPAWMIEFGKKGILSPDGRCRSFAKAANGSGFADGAGVLVLERLSTAERAGHRILALIRGSAVRQDGANSILGLPSVCSQEELIRASLADAGIAPREIDAVEGHGNGSLTHDPIEAEALIGVYGQGRDNPLRLGALMSNLGHTQAASGVGSVIKMVMAMRHGLLPRSLHIDEPSPSIEWDGSGVELLTAGVTWERTEGRRRRVGVSNIGFSGTNVHMILEESPESTRPADSIPIPISQGSTETLGSSAILLVSAKDPQALCDRAGQLAAVLQANPLIDTAGVALSLAHRPAFEHRAVIAGDGRSELLTGLEAIRTGTNSSRVIHGPPSHRRRTAFVFSGWAAQSLAGTRALLESSPVFADAVRACQTALTPYLEWSIEDVLRNTSGAPAPNEFEIAQPVLFGVMVSLAAVWRSAGVEPDAVIGQLDGEVAAAHVAGALSLVDAARIVALGSRAVASLAEEDAMASVPLHAAGSGTQARPLTVPQSSDRAESLRREFVEGLSSIRPDSSQVPFYSGATGAPIESAELGAEYFYRSLRGPIDFKRVTQRSLEDGIDAFIEMSPEPVLGPSIAESAESSESDPAILGALDTQEQDGEPALLWSMARAWAAGATIDRSALVCRPGAEEVDLPSYPFRRRRFWLDVETRIGAAPLGRHAAEMLGL